MLISDGKLEENKKAISLLKSNTYLALLPKEQKMKGHDKRKMYPKYLGLLAWYSIADRSNCLLNDLEPFDDKKVVLNICRFWGSLLSGSSALYLIPNSIEILIIRK